MSVTVLMNQGTQAFGMSITLGQNSLNVPNYWVNRFTQYLGGSVENRAISGTGLPSMAAQVNAFAPYGGRTKIAVADGPLNDIRQAGAAALPSVKIAYDSIVSSLFSGYFRGAAWPAPAVVRTGVWSHLGTSYGGRSCFFSNDPLYTTDPSASVTFQFSGPVVVVHGFATESTSWLDLDIEVDGVAWGSTTWSGKARPGAGTQAVATVIDGLGAGLHTIKLKPPVTGIPAGKACVVDGIQCPIFTGPVFLGSVPNIADWTAFGSIGTWTDAQACNLIIEQVCNEWRSRGFPVAFVDLTTFIDPARDFSSDGVHPTDRGHLNWALAYLSQARISP